MDFMSDIKYMPHIDGLRAIAVLCVLVFHAFPEALPGGFVGVDVFFVISGFLITSIIQKQITQQRFSIKEFYSRRIKRILPVYYSVALTTLVTAFFILLPEDLAGLAESAVASTLFISNYYFYATSGYFGPSVELVPLVHTWSLAVEEQFYIFWPIALIVFAKWCTPSLKFAGILLIFTISLGLSIVLSNSHPDFAYYGIATRTFELMVGAVFALYLPRLQSLPRWLVPVSVGVLMLSVAFIDKSWAFPGYVALFPCLATAVLITNGHRVHWINKTLSATLMVTVGLLSYSLYMWHWPVLSLLRHYYMEPSTVQLFGAIVGIFALAWLSRACIEKPMMRSAMSFRQALLSLFVLPTLMILALACALYAYKDSPLRYNTKEVALLESAKPVSNHCNVEEAYQTAKEGCIWNTGKGLPTVLVWGDSHAQHLWEAVTALAAQSQHEVELVTFSGCPPIKGVYRINRSFSQICFDHNTVVFNKIMTGSYDAVVLSSNWANYAKGPNLADDQDTSKSLANSKRALRTHLAAQIAALGQAEIPTLFVQPIPNFPNEAPRCHLNNIMFGHQETCHLTAEETSEQRASFVAFLSDEVSEHNTISQLSLDSIMCDALACSALRGERLLYSDKNHLSVEGSKRAAPLLKEAVNKALR
jgi:peptidoglycan/LPS O-acetylase OafA/YrhL